MATRTKHPENPTMSLRDRLQSLRQRYQAAPPDEVDLRAEIRSAERVLSAELAAAEMTEQQQAEAAAAAEREAKLAAAVAGYDAAEHAAISAAQHLDASLANLQDAYAKLKAAGGWAVSWQAYHRSV